MAAQITEFEARMEATMVEAVLLSPSAVALAALQGSASANPQKIANAAISAVDQALKEPGALVRIACDNPMDAIVMSDILDRLCSTLVGVSKIAEKSTKTFLELDNGSAIYIALKRKA